MKILVDTTDFHGILSAMIQRSSILATLKSALARSRVVVLVGPRQGGKTTLARQLLEEESVNYFDLEDPVNLARLDEPMTALRPLKGLVVIDEIQRCPDLFPVSGVLGDRKGIPARFLILGSASGNLTRQTSESLADRMERIVIGGFSLAELGLKAEQQLWLRGGLPLSYLAGSNTDSIVWRKNFIQTPLERDFPQWGVRIAATALQRFWTMVAHIWGRPPQTLTSRARTPLFTPHPGFPDFDNHMLVAHIFGSETCVIS